MVYQSEPGGDHVPERASDFDGFEGSTKSIDHGFRKPFATIGHADTVDFDRRHRSFDTSADGTSDLSGIERSAEFVRSDNDSYGHDLRDLHQLASALADFSTVHVRFGQVSAHNLSDLQDFVPLFHLNGFSTSIPLTDAIVYIKLIPPESDCWQDLFDIPNPTVLAIRVSAARYVLS
jgi:hypothetical protein